MGCYLWSVQEYQFADRSESNCFERTRGGQEPDAGAEVAGTVVGY